MGRTNGKSEVDPQELQSDDELPASDGAEETETTQVNKSKQAAQSAAAESELEKLKAERDTLIERLARLQAEFENARKRAAKEQHDFREYAQADAIKALLPILDSFEHALRAPGSDVSEFRSGRELIF